ncbi:MAG TPA: hypothetical protein VFS08_14835 [Gemmatimonadaceae bacterium]|nr:hypothetical protein [Gemmatimonadaceae bacterium]
MDRDEQYDLLTAALIGVALGAGAALLISAAVPHRPPPTRVQRAWRKGAKVVRRQGMMGLVAPESLRDQVKDYLDAARDTVTETVEAELKDLRRAIRRQRRRLGL